MARLAGLAVAAFVAAGAGGVHAASNLQIITYDSAKSTDQVRACLLKTLEAEARRKKVALPAEEAFTQSPANTSWSITFRHDGGPASIVVNARETSAQVLYPNQIARANPRLAQAIEDCG